MHDLSKLLAEEYNVDIKEVTPYKNYYKVECTSGSKLLKKSVIPPERLLFVHSVKEFLYDKGFSNTDRYICNASGQPYATIDGAVYTLCDMIDGQECDFENRDDIIRASRLLALMHKASKGYKPPQDCKACDYLGKLPFYYQKRLNEIKKLIKTARKGRSKFDYLFLKCSDEFCSEGEDAINLLSASKYEDIVRMYRRDGGLCHHDFTYSNILRDKSQVSLVNFEYCCLELKVYDLANFLKRKMRKCKWDVKEAWVILNEYCTIEDISKDELDIMKIMLKFPQKFWRVVNRYYNSNHSWSQKNYIYRLQEVIDELPYSTHFIDTLDKL